LLGYFIAFEADEAHPPLRQDMGICDLEAACEMIAKLVIGAGRWKTTNKHPGILHLGVVRLECLTASADVESRQEIFFFCLVCCWGGERGRWGGIGQTVNQRRSGQLWVSTRSIAVQQLEASGEQQSDFDTITSLAPAQLLLIDQLPQ
jgi:hypothetical protein